MSALNQFISKVQQSDDATKRFWLFLLSGVTMAVVLGLWLGYINLTIARVTPPTNPVIGSNSDDSRFATNDPREYGPGFFTIFSAGVKIIYDKIAEQIAVTRDITIENPRKNFIAEEVVPIPATKLP